jgi:hypothetical protein
MIENKGNNIKLPALLARQRLFAIPKAGLR